MTIAFVFPGQGSQRVGMGKALAEREPHARAVFEEADHALGFSLSKLCFDGPEEDLKQTASAQPAILATSIAVWRVLNERTGGFTPAYVLGHSLGEYSALVAAGALDLADALRVVRRRGELMQEAVPLGRGGMAAVLGAEAVRVEELCRAAAGDQVLTPANFNAPTQTVIAGHAEAIQRAVERGREFGAVVKPLKVSAPFHCALMAAAAERLRDPLAAIGIRAPRVPVIGNVDAEPYTDRVAERLVAQVTSPVRWYASVQRAAALGVTELLELGAGDTLAKLTKHIDKSLAATAVEAPDAIERAAAKLRAGT